MSKKSIGVVDYGSGNLRSACKALEAAGAATQLVTSKSQIKALDALVVPGVGAFGDCVVNLRNTGLWDSLRDWIHADRPFLGICVGYQLLFESSEESPEVEGLGVLEGRVFRFPAGTHKVPHMGWNTLENLRGPLYADLPERTAMYFVHSFYPVPTDSTMISAVCKYDSPFAASISRGALHGVQFHPEKSQTAGIALLRNFLSTV